MNKISIFTLLLAVSYFCALSANAIQLRDSGPPVIPSTATAPFIVAGSICDRQRNNLHEYVFLYYTNNNTCSGQAIYIKQSHIPNIKYAFLTIFVFVMALVVYKSKYKIKRILLTKVFWLIW